MSKKRLPPKVHTKGKRYYYVDQNKWTALSLVAEGIRELHRRLATLNDTPSHTMAGIFTAFADSTTFKELRPATQKQYTYFLFGRLTHTFGHMLPSEFTDGVIAHALGEAQGGRRAGVGQPGKGSPRRRF